jgi:enoyl-CoA hydratase/carnithine racemase
MDDFEHLEYELSDRVATIRLDRPEKRNALNDALVSELITALEAAEDATDVRVAVITGNGSVFSAGYDLYEGEPSLNDERKSDVEKWFWDPRKNRHRWLFTIYDLHIPVVAAVNGPALAGGSDLAAVCDITVASEEADFGYPAIRAGAPPVTLTYPFFASSIKHAKELLLTGDVVSAAEAERFGLVNETVPHDDLMDTVDEKVGSIKKVPSIATRILKQEANSVLSSQGFHPHVTDSGISSGLIHLAETNRKFFQRIDEEGLESALEIYEAEKP